MKKGSILIVDDNRNVLSALRILLNNYFEEVYTLPSPKTLLNTIREKNPDIILLDMNFSAGINTGNEGLFWLSEIKKQNPDIPIVLFTAYADISLAVNALKQGANDFIVKPWDNSKLIATLQSSLQLRQSKKEINRLKEKQSALNTELSKNQDVCWGTSSTMKNLLNLIEKVSATDANILITGENGTGKEVIAKRIHSLSNRKNETMVSVDMGAITESLFESELFGHAKGSFTDAKIDRIGKFEVADKGTLFLDEIGNLNYVLQAKLLTALQSRKVTRVGENTPIPVDIRLISATNKNLTQSVKDGEFREDLLYRINTIEIEVPPLRERKEDIPILAEFFLNKFVKKYNKGSLSLNKSAVEKLIKYPWPGNIRELQHSIEKAVILSEHKELQALDFYIDHIEKANTISDTISLEEMEILLIEKSLRKHEGNISAVALELGITRPTLYSKLKKYGMS